jgi:hypothetical protein
LGNVPRKRDSSVLSKSLRAPQDHRAIVTETTVPRLQRTTQKGLFKHGMRLPGRLHRGSLSHQVITLSHRRSAEAATPTRKIARRGNASRRLYSRAHQRRPPVGIFTTGATCWWLPIRDDSSDWLVLIVEHGWQQLNISTTDFLLRWAGGHFDLPAPVPRCRVPRLAGHTRRPAGHHR